MQPASDPTSQTAISWTLTDRQIQPVGFPYYMQVDSRLVLLNANPFAFGTGRFRVITGWMTAVRNLDKDAYRALKARAALTGKTVGEVLSEAIRSYLARSEALPRRGSLRDLAPESYPKGNRRLSEEIDAIVYGR